MIANISEIEKALNIEAGALQGAFDSKESVNINIADLVVRTKSEHDEFIKNIEAEKKERYESGKEKGVKDVINANIDKFGISLEGKAKTFDNFSEALTEKLQNELGKPRDEKLKELEADNEKLRSNYNEIESTFNSFKQSIEIEKDKFKIDNAIMSAIPKDNLLLEKDEIALIFKNRFSPDIKEGKILLKKEGEIIKDEKTLNPKGIDDIMPDFVSKYVKPSEGGRGVGDDPGTPKKSSLEQFDERMKAEGANPGSVQYNQALNQAMKEGTVDI